MKSGENLGNLGGEQPETNLSEVSADISSAGGDKINLEINPAEKLEQENADLRTENEDLKGRIQKLEGDYNELKDRISQLEKELGLTKETGEEIKIKEITAKDESEKWWNSLSKEEKETLMKSWQDKKAKYTGDLKTSSRKLPGQKDRPEYKPDTVRIGGMRVPSFDPNEFFKVPTVEDFNPNKPFEETETGTQVKSQLVHAMYRKGYGRPPLRGEQKRTVEETIQDFQNEEKGVLGDYYIILIDAAEDNGLDINDPATTKIIREAMVTAKRSLERHIVNNYGKKVYQERRSTWWLRFINFLNSDIAERKTIGKAMDIVAMNGGNIENAYAAIKNIVSGDENGEKDYSKIISYMNAHVRRAIKKSLDFSNKESKFLTPDDPQYDRYQTYRLLQQVYCESMADKIKAAPLTEMHNEEEVELAFKMLNNILFLQNERLSTIEENVGAKRWRDAWNKLKAAATGGLIGGTMLALAFGANDKDVKNKVYEQPKSRTPRIEKIEKIDQTINQTIIAPEKTGQNFGLQPKPSPKIIKAKIGDRDTAVEIDESGNVKEIVGSTAEELKKVHTAASKIQVSATEMGQKYNSFIPGLNSYHDLENFVKKFDQLTPAEKTGFNNYVGSWLLEDGKLKNDPSAGGYGTIIKEMKKGGYKSIRDWASDKSDELRKQLRIEDIDNTV